MKKSEYTFLCQLVEWYSNKTALKNEYSHDIVSPISNCNRAKWNILNNFPYYNVEKYQKIKNRFFDFFDVIEWCNVKEYHYISHFSTQKTTIFH